MAPVRRGAVVAATGAYPMLAGVGAALTLGVAGDLAVLAAVAVVIGPLAWWALGQAIDVARRDGALVSY